MWASPKRGEGGPGWDKARKGRTSHEPLAPRRQFVGTPRVLGLHGTTRPVHGHRRDPRSYCGACTEGGCRCLRARRRERELRQTSTTRRVVATSQPLNSDRFSPTNISTRTHFSIPLIHLRLPPLSDTPRITT